MKILLAGSIAFDYLMSFPGKFKDTLIEQSLDKISVSFLVDEMVKHNGGVSANIGYTMALLGSKPMIFGTVGIDFEPYRQHLERVGVDCSTVRVIDGVFTGSFFANTDTDNNQIASFYAGAMGLAHRYNIADVVSENPDLVVISPNDPVAMSNQIDECRANNIPYLFDPSQQVARVDDEFLQRGIEGCAMLACNEYEWEVIQKRTNYTIDTIKENGHIFIHTLGEDGANIYSGNEVIHIPTMSPNKITEPTGAGDAFRAGLLRGYELGLPWEIAGRMGSLCAAYDLEFSGTQNHTFTISEFVERYRQSHDDEGALDALLASASA